MFNFYRIAELIPSPVNNLLKKLGANKLILLFTNKHKLELSFWKDWVKKYPNIPAATKYVKDIWENHRHLSSVLNTANIQPTDKVLDVGCGIGTFLFLVPGEKIGYDPLANAYKDLFHFPDDIKMIEGPGEAMPFKNASFDKVICSNVLDHVTTPEDTIKEIDRVLKPGGTFIFTIEAFPRNKLRDPSHPHSFTKQQAKDLVNNYTILFEGERPWPMREEEGHIDYTLVLQKPSAS
jgi:SAM-dependent methyltransferase